MSGRGHCHDTAVHDSVDRAEVERPFTEVDQKIETSKLVQI